MSWGVEVWDQYDKVCTHTELGIEFIKRVQTFAEKRIHVEQNYAKELRRLVKAFRRKDEEESVYTAVKGFGKIILETNDLAGQRELVAEYMEAEVLTPLKSIARDITVDRKKHLTTGTECLRQLKVTSDTLERTKKAYEKASEEGEAAMHTLEKADNDPNSTKAKIDKLTTTLRQKEQTAEDCRNTYILQLERTNLDRERHYKTTMPAVFKDLQDMNAKRINDYKDIVSTFADCQRRVLPIVNTCLDNITAASTAMDPDKDNQQLVMECKTGFPIPGDVEFVEYMGKQSKKAGGHKKGKVEPREDFGHLPPEQQRRKLQHKVDQLEALINKTLADKNAMEKMQTIYTDNPKLGDAQAVEQSLVICQRRIEELGNEMERYKGYLTSAILRINEKPDRKNTTPSAASRPVYSKPAVTEAPPPKPSHPNNNQVNNTDQDEFDDDDDDDGSEEATPQVGGGKDEEWDDIDSEEADTTGGGQLKTAMMLYDFAGQNEEELSCYANDVVSILDDLGDGWLRVRKGNEEGYVPESYAKRN